MTRLYPDPARGDLRDLLETRLKKLEGAVMHRRAFLSVLSGSLLAAHLMEAAEIQLKMEATGGETLADHAGSSESLAAIRDSQWQFVVLQEQSEIPSVAALRQSQMEPAARSLVELVRTARATPTRREAVSEPVRMR